MVLRLYGLGCGESRASVCSVSVIGIIKNNHINHILTDKNRESGGPKLPETVLTLSDRSLGAGESAGHWAVDPGHVSRPAGDTVSDIVTPLTAREMVWFIYFGVKFVWSRWLRPTKLTYDFHHNRNPNISEPFSPVQHRHVARGSNVPRNTGRYGSLSSAASHERRDLRLRSVGQAGPDPARVKRPREGNVSRVESAALEWECSAIYAVASGFREYFERQDCSPACWLQVRTNIWRLLTGETP